ncbi:hypothetical protein NE237_000739 [Protea cynaroides]|uniref:Uncharacterized protein n=1 Tax=Protea cynaroides TaxID=273540 RepID=A0A9Q0KRR4_9MAGN|nr:hypothetical protein NE237_000739 [Protea cynaroides]
MRANDASGVPPSPRNGTWFKGSVRSREGLCFGFLAFFFCSNLFEAFDVIFSVSRSPITSARVFSVSMENASEGVPRENHGALEGGTTQENSSSSILDLNSYQLHDLVVELPPSLVELDLTANHRLSALDPRISLLSHLKKLSKHNNQELQL